ncbi:hypothetical protein OIE13_34070 [Streptosporangium sp. NBC_01810]|uniref:hypothetical protein n=1 Tax=Streptosporangium sp. NBC_01810 TaxID=2975951 RepID=UPI002DDC7575|nr:hypothetical protein [Streptosporangium sp. NBC_01810]WSA25878.1 hypothetical protein OIE13_34070 [Streptosporangium sp. NBC_01810]
MRIVDVHLPIDGETTVEWRHRHRHRPRRREHPAVRSRSAVFIAVGSTVGSTAVTPTVASTRSAARVAAGVLSLRLHAARWFRCP